MKKRPCYYIDHIKPILDPICAAMLILILAVPMALIGLLVALTSRGGALFIQKRVGRNNRLFRCVKFRTMYKGTPTNIPTKDFFDAEDHITPIGRLLRRTSLDELPQLFCVVTGRMSLVGPRPLIPEEREVHRERNAMGVDRLRPGITGLAQINGRDKLSDGEKVALDAEYLSRVSFFTDMKILALTVVKVVRCGDVVCCERRRADVRERKKQRYY